MSGKGRKEEKDCQAKPSRIASIATTSLAQILSGWIVERGGGYSNSLGKPTFGKKGRGPKGNAYLCIDQRRGYTFGPNWGYRPPTPWNKTKNKMETQEGPDLCGAKSSPEKKDVLVEESSLGEDACDGRKPSKSLARIQRERRGYAYLTKRKLVRAVLKASQVAAREALCVSGFVLVAENGWLVKLHQDGTKEQLRLLNP